MTTLVIGIVLVTFIVAMTAINIRRKRDNKNETFLEWDPVQRTAWREELDDADVFHMLDLHNQTRARQGLDPQTMDEYREDMRRRSRP